MGTTLRTNNVQLRSAVQAEPGIGRIIGLALRTKHSKHLKIGPRIMFWFERKTVWFIVADSGGESGLQSG
jgi:hypothetical protein